MTLNSALYWLGLAGAAAGVLVYFLGVAWLRKNVRLIGGAGLFFTAIGLAESAIALHAAGADTGRAIPGAVAVVALLIAVYFQAISALRQRRTRAADGSQPSGAA